MSGYATLNSTCKFLEEITNQNLCEDLFISRLSNLRVVPEALDELRKELVQNPEEILLDISQ